LNDRDTGAKAAFTSQNLKHENHTPIGAFNLRGGMSILTDSSARDHRCKGSPRAVTTANRWLLPERTPALPDPALTHPTRSPFFFSEKKPLDVRTNWLV
jgi:hypothetical protein